MRIEQGDTDSEGSYAEMLPTLEEQAARTDLPASARARIESNLAWTLAHVGQGERAVTIARALVARLPASGWPRARAIASLGVALASAGHAAEALLWLERALAVPGLDEWTQAALLYFRAEALLGMGRRDGARASWKLVRTTHPTGPYAALAEVRLSELHPVPRVPVLGAGGSGPASGIMGGCSGRED